MARDSLLRACATGVGCRALINAATPQLMRQIAVDFRQKLGIERAVGAAGTRGNASI